MQRLNQPKKESVPLPLQSKQQLAEDSEQEEEDSEELDLRRQMPGHGGYSMASAQIGTIVYAVPENSRSPRNILAADLGAG